jgi:hypothetical protein
MYQEKYWKELYQLKVHLNYVELYLQDSEYKEKAVNIFLALTSSGSIAAWVIWQKVAVIWAFIIAASQVVTAIKNFLPYKERLKALFGLVHDFEDIVLIAEKKWFDVAEGKLTEEEIHKLQFDIRSKKTMALKKHLGSKILPEKAQLMIKAQASADVYFNNFYPKEKTNV